MATSDGRSTPPRRLRTHDSTIENTSKNKNVELGFSDEERDQELPDFPSFIPFLPPLSAANLKVYYATRFTIIVGIMVFGGFLAPIKCTQVIHLVKSKTFESLWASCVTVDASESWLVMYDAFGVRLHVGKQAEVLNQIVYELPSEHPLAETRPLRELLGHTPPQVFAGGVLGFAVATFTAMIAGLGS
ncbi:Protein ORANGE, chloroplastic [Zea mays]|uniref:Protein ORANGE, chloroplastic n=1 Tax=Zea mays TaxID=4577 RepID=A0A3L6DN66_MAIZE|nr:Protein ORANGE, chloroplastic [Zea mays]